MDKNKLKIAINTFSNIVGSLEDYIRNDYVNLLDMPKYKDAFDNDMKMVENANVILEELKNYLNEGNKNDL